MTVHNQLSLFGDYSTIGGNKPPKAKPRGKVGSGGESGPNHFSGDREVPLRGRRKGDVSVAEIDRREYPGKVIVLLEDRRLMQEDGTSYQYILGIERISKNGEATVADRRYITGLMKKRGHANAYEAARAIFLNPGDFGGILGEQWGREGEGEPSEESKVA